MGSKLPAIILLCILLLSGSMPLLGSSAPLQRVSALAQSSCPANDIIRITTPTLPNSFNTLTAATFSAFWIPALEYSNIYPYPLGPGGALLWNESSITNSVSHNSNYTQWTFNVTPGLKWSDGDNITSQDLLNEYSSQYALNASYDFVGLHSEITSSHILNSTAAVFTLNQTDAHLPEKMSSIIFTNVVSPEAIQQGPGANLFGSNVGFGPFYATNYTSGTATLRMLRNPYFHPQPTACEVDANFAESTSQITEFLQSGSTDIGGPLDPSNVASLKNLPNIQILDEKAVSIDSLEYNITDYPYNMTAFRQALAYSLNESEYVSQALGGYGITAYNGQGTVPSNSPIYNSNQMTYNFNQTKGLQLLNSIGIKKGSDGYLQFPNGTDISLTVWTDTEHTFDTVMGGLVQTDLNNLGFKNVGLQTVSPSTITGDYDSNTNGIRDSLIIWNSEAPLFADPWLSSQPGWNVYLRPGYPNSHWLMPPSADALYQGNLTGIDSTGDPAQERQLSNNIQALDAQYLPIISLCYGDEIFAFNTQRWVGWPTGVMFEGVYANYTSLSLVQPSSGTSTSTSSTPTGTTATSLTTASSPTTTVSTTSSSGGTVANNWFVTFIIATVVAIGILATSFVRKR